ncbi:hypothetical protein H257_17314 [Aphanomyces astaci]|uniref:Uncharacterized protein n=1 Tax=Aphanomyces astaci TaxID=112090 RepID=W4FF82_APHAT|nr:hypothetical protein H257_17314 [Aphanomyces astaci]ETV66162.1 hypothetical protein H257_17314 [Aphanomyces astaci]|eukprot:XP_009844351.1 hypothetical protein H257_17314 [Aphanomyces astaci]
MSTIASTNPKIQHVMSRYHDVAGMGFICDNVKIIEEDAKSFDIDLEPCPDRFKESPKYVRRKYLKSIHVPDVYTRVLLSTKLPSPSSQ